MAQQISLGKEANSARHVQRILLGVVTSLGYLVGDVVDGHDAIKEDHRHKSKQKKCYIIKNINETDL
jgi:hypothetical protein